MKTPLARVDWISDEEVHATIDTPLRSGELAVSEDGRWFGVITSVRESRVILRSFDPPEYLEIDGLLRFPGAPRLPELEHPQWGTVIDPLGRVLAAYRPSAPDRTSDYHRSFWGLGRLESAFELHRGTSVVLAGDESVGPARLLAEALRRAEADWVVALCQGGLRELNRLLAAARIAGTSERALFVWAPLWNRPAMGLAIPACLEALIAAAPSGHGLIVFDDLRRWMETEREWSEESNEDLLPSGFAPQCRADLARLLELPVAEHQTSVSLLAGWTFDRTSPTLAAHPYGRLVELQTDRGIVLENRQEHLIPTDDCWGGRNLLAMSHRALAEASMVGDDEIRPMMDRIDELLGNLYLSIGSDEMDDVPHSPWSAGDHAHLLALLETPATHAADFFTRMNQFSFHSLDGPEAARRAFCSWLASPGKGDARP